MTIKNDQLAERLEEVMIWASEGLEAFTASDDPQAREVNMIRWLRRAQAFRPLPEWNRPKD